MPFNKGIALLYYRKNKIPIFFKQQLCYKLGACKNNYRSLRVKVSKTFLIDVMSSSAKGAPQKLIKV